MKKTAILLVLITIFSNIFGFAREISLSYFYGASNISDAYIISVTIPMTIFGFIAAGISTSYIPIYSKIEAEAGEIKGIDFTNKLVNILIIICTVVISLALIFVKPIVNIFASGFSNETLAIAVKLTRISLFGIYFVGLNAVFTGFLQLKRNYFIPALVGFPMNFLIILSMYLSSKGSVSYLSYGYVIAIASQLLLILPYIYKLNYKYKLVIDIRDKYIKNMAYVAFPVIIGVSVNQINVLVDRTLASNIAMGGISALSYANKLNGFVQGLFVTTIATIMYPLISKMVVANNMKGLKKTLSEALIGVNLLVLPITVGTMIFAEPIVKLLFGRGAFDREAVSMTGNALFFFSIGMVGFGLREVLSRVFYSMEDTKTPMINAAVGVTLNIILNIFLSKFMGVGGLAFATSISAIITTGLLFISLRKKIGPFGMKQISISFIKILLASLIMGLIARLSYNYLITSVNNSLLLILSIILGGLSYFVIIYFMKIKDIDLFLNVFKRKIGRK
ncbi:murein biosynthesis integral membrane protein MurJ [Bacillus sp. MM2020_1]|nr:murein biosynthesis integral membrane protein MurJ [Bacillus sp. MM2020_1]